MKKKIFGILLVLALFCSCGSKENEPSESEASTANIDEIITKAEEGAGKAEPSSKSQEKENPKSDEKEKNIAKEKEKPEKKKTGKKVSINIRTFGDIMCHQGQFIYAGNVTGGNGYDFSEQFQYIKDYVEGADFAIGNYETTSNDDLPYAGYPMFNTPSSYIDDLKAVGFDCLTTANNHSLDTGIDGLEKTIDKMDEVGISHVGTHKKAEERYIIKNVKGIKVAVLSYAYGFNGNDYNLDEKELEKLNYLDEEKIEEDIKSARKRADLVLVYPHRGIEYQSYPSNDQVILAHKMANWGADLIIGNHPHVVQPAEFYKTKDGREVFIGYALGNLISQQSLEGLGDIRTEQDVSYEIEVTKDLDDNSIKIDKVTSHPMWVGKHYNNYGSHVVAHLTEDFIDGGRYADQVDQYQLERIQKANDMTNETVDTKVADVEVMEDSSSDPGEGTN